MKIISTNIAKPTTFIWNGKQETTGIYKKPTNKPIYLTKNDVINDEISNRLNHGGYYKACYLFSSEQYPYWKNLYHYYVSNPLAFEFYEFVARPPAISQELINETKAYYINHTKYFKEEIDNGSLKKMDLALIVQLSVNTVVAAVSLKLNHTLEMNEKQLNDAVNASWDLVKNIED